MGKLTVKEDQRYRELNGLLTLLNDMKKSGNNCMEHHRAEIETELAPLKAKLQSKDSIAARNPRAAERPGPVRKYMDIIAPVKEPNLFDKLWQWCMKK